MRVSGEGNRRREFPFYSEMEVLLGDRPVANLKGSTQPKSLQLNRRVSQVVYRNLSRHLLLQVKFLKLVHLGKSTV
jgi:hypothetical protein